MSIRVKLPTFFGLHPDLSVTNSGFRNIDVEGRSVGECIDQLEARFEGIKRKLCDEKGQLHFYWDLYLNSKIILLDGPDLMLMPLKNGDQLTINLVATDG